jgi:hypothetical protein
VHACQREEVGNVPPLAVHVVPFELTRTVDEYKNVAINVEPDPPMHATACPIPDGIVAVDQVTPSVEVLMKGTGVSSPDLPPAINFEPSQITL